MAPSGLFLQKDDFYRDSIRDSQSGATGYRWSLQDLAALLRKLQIQGPRPHRPQQPPSIHGYEEFELQTSLVGPRTLLIPLSHELLIGKSKWSCRRSILLPPEVNRWGSRSESWKLPYSSSVTKFTDQSQPSKASLFQPQSKANKQLFFSPQGIHLWDSRFPVAVSVLGRTLGQASQREAYKISIGGMQLRLTKLQANEPKTKDFWSKNGLAEGWDDVDRFFYHQCLQYVPEIIRTKLISRHHDDSLARHFEIEKTRELVAQKYYWLTLRLDVKTYVKGCDVCLASKPVQHKPYWDLQFFPVPTNRWRDLSMDFVISLSILTNWKCKSYDSILIIVNRLTKMVHYEPVKVTVNALSLAEVIIDMVVQHHSLLHSIVSD